MHLTRILAPRHRGVVLNFLGLPVLLLSLSAPSAGAADRPGRLERQIEIMSRAIDEMLLDSPNFLVSGRDVTDGIEDEGQGVLFTFGASLTGAGWVEGDGDHVFWPWSRGREHRVVILKGEDGQEQEIEVGGGRVKLHDGDATLGRKLKGLLDLDGKEVEVLDDKTYRERQLKKYGLAKDELVQVLMDYGEVLTEVPAGQSVRLLVRLRDLDLPKETRIRKLTLHVGIDNLRAYSAGRLSESEIRSRIAVKES